MGGNDSHIKGNPKFCQDIRGFRHNRHIRITAHYDSNLCHKITCPFLVPVIL